MIDDENVMDASVFIILFEDPYSHYIWCSVYFLLINHQRTIINTIYIMCVSQVFKDQLMLPSNNVKLMNGNILRTKQTNKKKLLNRKLVINHLKISSHTEAN